MEYSDIDGNILCPVCKDIYVHPVKVYRMPNGEGFQGSGGVAIDFCCEHCNQFAPEEYRMADVVGTLIIEYHKGPTNVRWVLHVAFQSPDRVREYKSLIQQYSSSVSKLRKLRSTWSSVSSPSGAQEVLATWRE